MSLDPIFRVTPILNLREGPSLCSSLKKWQVYDGVHSAHFFYSDIEHCWLFIFNSGIVTVNGTPIKDEYYIIEDSAQIGIGDKLFNFHNLSDSCSFSKILSNSLIKSKNLAMKSENILKMIESYVPRYKDLSFTYEAMANNPIFTYKSGELILNAEILYNHLLNNTSPYMETAKFEYNSVFNKKFITETISVKAISTNPNFQIFNKAAATKTVKYLWPTKEMLRKFIYTSDTSPTHIESIRVENTTRRYINSYVVGKCCEKTQKKSDDLKIIESESEEGSYELNCSNCKGDIARNKEEKLCDSNNPKYSKKKHMNKEVSSQSSDEISCRSKLNGDSCGKVSYRTASESSDKESQCSCSNTNYRNKSNSNISDNTHYLSDSDSQEDDSCSHRHKNEKSNHSNSNTSQTLRGSSDNQFDNYNTITNEDNSNEYEDTISTLSSDRSMKRKQKHTKISKASECKTTNDKAVTCHIKEAFQKNRDIADGRVPSIGKRKESQINIKQCRCKFLYEFPTVIEDMQFTSDSEASVASFRSELGGRRTETLQERFKRRSFVEHEMLSRRKCYDRYFPVDKFDRSM